MQPGSLIGSGVVEGAPQLSAPTSSASPVTQGDTFTHTQPDLLIVTDFNALQPTGVSNLYFRHIDFNNRWTLETRADGNYLLYERVAPAGTALRAESGPGAVASGDRVIVSVVSGVYTAYLGGAFMWTYTDAAEALITETGAVMSSLATGAVYDIAFYPNTSANRSALGI